MTARAKLKCDGVLWDLDGTLISTKKLYLECYRRALAPYVGRTLSDDELLALDPRSETRLLREQAPDALEACLRDFAQHYAELHGELFGGIYPGVIETLQELRARSVKMGIVTGKSRSAFEITVARIELGPFDVVILDDDVNEPKPHPQGLQAAIARVRLNPQRVIYVGDSASDVRAALAAGAQPGVALWSRRPEKRVEFAQRMLAEGDVLLLESPADVLPLARYV